MTTVPSHDRRKNYFIKKEFQTRFIMKFCLLVVLTALISSVVIYRFSSQSVATVFENSRLIIKPGTEFIMPGLLLSTLISVVLVGMATIFVVLFISHRIAGPLYKLEHSLERVGSGDLGFDIHFRKGDEAKRMAAIFNATSRNLNKLLKDINTEYAHLNSAARELRDAVKDLPVEYQTLKDAAKRLDGVNARLSKKLSRFRLR